MLLPPVQHLGEPIKKGLLSFQNPFTCGLYGKPTSTIDFRNLDHAAGARRPLHLTVIANQFVRVAIALKGPGSYNLAACLLHHAEFVKTPLRGKARFLLKFAFRRFERNLALRIFAFADGPGTQIFLRPKGAARMHQEHFHLAVASSIHQQTRAAFWHVIIRSAKLKADRCRWLAARAQSSRPGLPP